MLEIVRWTEQDGQAPLATGKANHPNSGLGKLQRPYTPKSQAGQNG